MTLALQGLGRSAEARGTLEELIARWLHTAAVPPPGMHARYAIAPKELIDLLPGIVGPDAARVAEQLAAAGAIEELADMF